jgi:hypothetical protein
MPILFALPSEPILVHRISFSSEFVHEYTLFQTPEIAQDGNLAQKGKSLQSQRAANGEGAR